MLPSGAHVGWSDRTRTLLSTALLGAILAVFVLVRLPLLTRDAATRGWNGDSAIFGLMAKKIHDGRGIDVFFWGQNYTGPLTPALAAGIRLAILDPAGFGAEGGPIALRLASMGEIAFGICFYVLGLARLFGPAIAGAAGLWMAIGPPFLIRLSAVPKGPEMSFALGSVLFFLAADVLTRPRPVLDRPGGRFAFGLLAGVALWMNQTIVFVLMPVAALVLLRGGLRVLAPVIGGAALGYAPVWMGRLFGWYEPSAGPVFPPWLPSGFFTRVLRFLGVDAWRFVGLDGLASQAVLGVAAPVLLSLLALRAWGMKPSARGKRRGPGGLGFVAAVAGLAALTFLVRNVSPSQQRYFAPALPAALALILVALVEAANRLGRIVPFALVAAVAGGLSLLAAVFLWRQARGAVGGILREPDPLAPLATILEKGYTVCHAGYDAAYTLQFLSDERVRFVPYHSPDRNRTQSARLRATPGPQCLVQEDGRVREWLPSDAAQEGGPAPRRAETRPGSGD